jgi:hypothetical protein
VREENGAVVVWGEDAETGMFWAELSGTVAAVGTRVAPHMPQKRLVPGLSLPQREQRTKPPKDISDPEIPYCSSIILEILAYDILDFDAAASMPIAQKE